MCFLLYFLTMNTFCKSERLCNKKLFEDLMSSGCSFIKYPFRVVFKVSALPGDHPARIAISVSKKKFKRAVKRNRIKRLTREAYRLSKTGFYENIDPGLTLDILFIYLDNQVLEYAKIEPAMKNALQKLCVKMKEM